MFFSSSLDNGLIKAVIEKVLLNTEGTASQVGSARANRSLLGEILQTHAWPPSAHKNAL